MSMKGTLSSNQQISKIQTLNNSSNQIIRQLQTNQSIKAPNFDQKIRKFQKLCRQDCIDQGHKYCINRSETFLDKSQSFSGTCCNSSEISSDIKKCTSWEKTSSSILCSLPNQDEKVKAINYLLCPISDPVKYCGQQIIQLNTELPPAPPQVIEEVKEAPLKNQSRSKPGTIQRVDSPQKPINTFQSVTTEISLKEPFSNNDQIQSESVCTYAIYFPTELQKEGQSFQLKIKNMKGVEVVVSQINLENRGLQDVNSSLNIQQNLQQLDVNFTPETAQWISLLNLERYSSQKVERQGQKFNVTLLSDQSEDIPLFITVWPSVNSTGIQQFKAEAIYSVGADGASILQDEDVPTIPSKTDNYFISREEDGFGHFIDAITVEIGLSNVVVLIILAVSLLIICILTCLSMFFCFRKINADERERIEEERKEKAKKQLEKKGGYLFRSPSNKILDIIDFDKIPYESQIMFNNSTRVPTITKQNIQAQNQQKQHDSLGGESEQDSACVSSHDNQSLNESPLSVNVPNIDNKNNASAIKKYQNIMEKTSVQSLKSNYFSQTKQDEAKQTNEKIQLTEQQSKDLHPFDPNQGDSADQINLEVRGMTFGNNKMADAQKRGNNVFQTEINRKAAQHHVSQASIYSPISSEQFSFNKAENFQNNLSNSNVQDDKINSQGNFQQPKQGAIVSKRLPSKSPSRSPGISNRETSPIDQQKMMRRAAAATWTNQEEQSSDSNSQQLKQIIKLNQNSDGTTSNRPGGNPQSQNAIKQASLQNAVKQMGQNQKMFKVSEFPQF